jgi:hypothetical protein
VTQPIKTVDHMREQIKKLPGRMPTRTTLNAICLEVSSNTVADFALRPHKRKNINMSSLFDVFVVTSHELVAARPDLAEFVIRSDDDLKAFLRKLCEVTGKTISAMSDQAGISLTLVTWLTGSSRRKTVQLEPLLKLLNSEKVTLKLRKIPMARSTAKRAMMIGS